MKIVNNWEDVLYTINKLKETYEVTHVSMDRDIKDTKLKEEYREYEQDDTFTITIKCKQCTKS